MTATLMNAATPVWIDSDNAMGAPSGDVDDAFAIAALLRSGTPVAALSSVAGNTGEPQAATNNARLAAVCSSTVPLLRGMGAGVEHGLERFATGFEGSLRIAALGPLTNVAAALRLLPAGCVEDVVIVGGNRISSGRWPPIWPHEFNITADVVAAREVFDSGVPLTILPLDVARRLTVGRRELARIDGPLGDYMTQCCERWFFRTLVVHLSTRFRVWDLPAALHLLDAPTLERSTTTVHLHGNGWIEFGAGERRASVITGLDPATLWQRFLEIVNGHQR